tara:strand:- start:56 stop:466 length:411 start_codon:yes stop_codon:yes gene_type:complete
MKNYTLKQRLKAKYIVELEINSFRYPQNYKDIIENLNKYNSIGELKISQAVQILEHTTNDSSELNKIYRIFASTEEEVQQIQTDLKNYINKGKSKDDVLLEQLKGEREFNPKMNMTDAQINDLVQDVKDEVKEKNL